MSRSPTDLSDLSASSSRHTVHLFFPLSFCFISMVLDLLAPTPSPLYIVSFHLLHFVTQMTFCYVPDLSSFAFPLPVFWFPLFFRVSVSGALLDVVCPLCVVIFQRSLQGSVLISGPQSHRHGAVVRHSTLQSCKTLPPKPLVSPKVKDKKGCHFSPPYAFFEIHDVWLHFGDH